MGYQRSTGQWADAENVTLHANANLTASANTTPVETDRGTLRATLTVANLQGDTTVDVDIETRKDSNDAWRVVGSFTQATADGAERLCFAGCDREVRAAITMAGSSPDADVEIVGEFA